MPIITINNHNAHCDVCYMTALETVIDVSVLEHPILSCFGQVVPEFNGKRLFKFKRQGDQLRLYFSNFPYNLSPGISNPLSYKLEVYFHDVNIRLGVLAGIISDTKISLHIDAEATSQNESVLFLFSKILNSPNVSFGDTRFAIEAAKFTTIHNNHVILDLFRTVEKDDWKVIGF